MTIPATLQGRAWVWPDNVNTDIIIPFRFKARTNDPVEMAKYAMYGFDPEFYKKVKQGASTRCYQVRGRCCGCRGEFRAHLLPKQFRDRSAGLGGSRD